MSVSRSGFISDVTDTPSLMTSLEERQPLETHPEQKKRRVSRDLKLTGNESGQSVHVVNEKVGRKLFSSPSISGIAGNQNEFSKANELNVCTVLSNCHCAFLSNHFSAVF